MKLDDTEEKSIIFSLSTSSSPNTSTLITNKLKKDFSYHTNQPTKRCKKMAKNPSTQREKKPSGDDPEPDRAAKRVKPSSAKLARPSSSDKAAPTVIIPSTRPKQRAASHGAAKRAKTSSARTILAQTSDKSLNQHGDLDVSSFVKAREFEIHAMDSSMRSSKKALSARAFQQVPRDLRRRTASHNVKRVPKRLRAKANLEVSGWAEWIV